MDRVPGLGERAVHVRQLMVDSRLRARQYTRDHGRTRPRAYLAFNLNNEITAIPVMLRLIDGRYLVSVQGEFVESLPQLGQVAMLLVDGGWHSLELRGLRVRGRLRDGGGASALDLSGSRLLELVPERTIGWDYGRMRPRGGE